MILSLLYWILTRVGKTTNILSKPFALQTAVCLYFLYYSEEMSYFWLQGSFLEPLITRTITCSVRQKFSVFTSVLGIFSSSFLSIRVRHISKQAIHLLIRLIVWIQSSGSVFLVFFSPFFHLFNPMKSFRVHQEGGRRGKGGVRIWKLLHPTAELFTFYVPLSIWFI